MSHFKGKWSMNDFVIIWQKIVYIIQGLDSCATRIQYISALADPAFVTMF